MTAKAGLTTAEIESVKAQADIDAILQNTARGVLTLYAPSRRGPDLSRRTRTLRLQFLGAQRSSPSGKSRSDRLTGRRRASGALRVVR